MPTPNSVTNRSHRTAASRRQPHTLLRDQPSPSRATVLVVDYDNTVRNTLRLVLEPAYRVVEVANGEAALKLIPIHRPDVVLLDVLLPHMDGLEVLKEIKVLNADLPVILVTAVKTVQGAVAAMKLGADDYLTKPFRDNEILEAVHAALRRRHEPVTASDPRQHRRIMILSDDIGRRAILTVTLEPIAFVDTRSLASRVTSSCSRAFSDIIVDAEAGQGTIVSALLAALPEPQLARLLLIGDPTDPSLSRHMACGRVQHLIERQASLSALRWRILGLLNVAHAPITFSAHIERALAHVHGHYFEPLTLDTLARAVGTSVSHLTHLFPAQLGLTIGDYLVRVRAEGAKHLLTTTDAKLAKIANDTGFFDASHLSRTLRKLTGRRPSTYRSAQAS